MQIKRLDSEIDRQRVGVRRTGRQMGMETHIQTHIYVERDRDRLGEGQR